MKSSSPTSSRRNQRGTRRGGSSNPKLPSQALELAALLHLCRSAKESTTCIARYLRILDKSLLLLATTLSGLSRRRLEQKSFQNLITALSRRKSKRGHHRGS